MAINGTKGILGEGTCFQTGKSGPMPIITNMYTVQNTGPIFPHLQAGMCASLCSRCHTYCL